MPLTRLTAPANLAGLPALSLPVPGGPAGLPASLQLIGPPGGEEQLIALGRVIEAAAMRRREGVSPQTQWTDPSASPWSG
jgi:amidase